LLEAWRGFGIERQKRMSVRPSDQGTMDVVQRTGKRGKKML
jgi:hypothetical protein